MANPKPTGKVPGVVSYRVFARKYRPRTFSEVVGQEHITKTLQNAIRQDRLAQAYLFVGPRGIGKTSTARILAKALNCEKGPTAEPCGQCPSCLEIAEGNNLDVLEIDGASNNGVDNIRDLRDNVQYTPSRGPYKIYLIDEVHMLSAGAFNALLKTLEEPPPHVKFLFATTEAQKLPATITSRCQRFDLRRIPDEKIATHLLMIAGCEKIQLEAEAARAIARGADGGLRDAESMLDQLVAFCGETITAADVLEVFGFTSHETIGSLAGALLGADLARALEMVADQDAQGKDLGRLLNDLIGYWRDMLVARASAHGAPELLAHASLTSREKLLELLEHFAECEARLRWATDKRMQADVAMIKAVHLLEQASLSDVLETIAELRDGQPVSRPLPSAQTPATPKKQPAPTPIPAAPTPDPSPKAAPAPPTPSAPSAPSAPASPQPAAQLWHEISTRLSAQSPFKFGWIESGQFQMEREGRLVVEFAASFREAAEGVMWEEPQKQLDQELSRAFGRPIRFHAEFLEHLSPPAEDSETSEFSEPRPSADEPEATTPTKTTDNLPTTPANDPGHNPATDLEAFKNDPLIQKALEVFEGKLLPSTKS